MERYNGYDDEFDYAGKDLVAPPGYLRGVGSRRVKGYTGKQQGLQSLSNAATSVMAGIQARQRGGGAARAMGVWKKMSDKRVCMHVQGLSLRQNRASRELVAYVDASVWLHEFSMMAPSYLQEWNHLCAGNGLDMTANKLTFRLSSHARAAGQNGSLSSSGGEQEVAPIPLTPDECARVESRVSSITNERLRKKAYDAMKSVMEWEKAKKLQNGA